MDKVSLTASMRSNLLSLQNISRQVDSTQNKLSTGKKVNSAIDNPSSYYTARSLTNRASDLDALLDSMGQAVSTIKAATEALESGVEFLEQAKAVANQALENTHSIIAHVSTEDELLAAVNSGKQGLIVLDSDITMSADQNIELKDGQSLVSSRYINGSGKQYKLTFNLNGDASAGIVVGNSSLVSDINIEVSGTSGLTGIYLNNKEKVRINNVNINMDEQLLFRRSIYANNSSYVVSGTINIKISPGELGVGTNSFGIANYNSILDIDKNSIVNIKGMEKAHCRAIGNYQNSTITVNSGAKLNIDTHDQSSWALENHVNSKFYVKSGAEINFNSVGEAAIINNHWAGEGNCLVYFESGSKVNLTSSFDWIISNVQPAGKANTVFFEKGVEVSSISNGRKGIWYTNSDYECKISYISGWNFDNLTEFKKISTTPNPAINIDIDAEMAKENEVLYFGNLNTSQYVSIINQYDSLIKDAGYKGVNLLQDQDLKVTFNEGRTSWLDVLGKDASSAALGLSTLKWNSKEDVEKSIEELTNATNQIRSMSSELGSYYNIVLNRQDFTENLINVLEEGADKLTLADMNEESANMLALQTRQQLATNSLSLASQAAQSILRLF